MAQDLEAIKSKLNIVDVVKRYVPKLERAGRNYKAPCPFHAEKTPSFMVNPDLGIFKCFGCGEGGDVISFIEKIERITFREAISVAAEYAGIEIQMTEDPKAKEWRGRVLKANQLAADFWNFLLTKHNAGSRGRAYVAKRQIREEEIALFKMGYAPNGRELCKFLNSRGFSDAELEKIGLAVARGRDYIDKFRDRLMLPIFNMKGEVVGFSGRIIIKDDKAPKYLNSPETTVYKKSDILMGLYQAKDAARAARSIILEEGNLDLMSSHKVGIKNIAASGGTALTPQQLKLLSRYADTILFALDSDAAGLKALIKGIEIAESLGIAHKAIDLHGYQDPDAMISDNPQLWAQVVNAPMNSLDYVLKRLTEGLDLGNPDDKSKLLKEFVNVLRGVKDPAQQSHFAGVLAEKIGITREMVLQRIGTNSEPAIAPSPPTTNNPKQGYSETYFVALCCAVSNISEYDIDTAILSSTPAQDIIELLNAYPQERNFGKLADLLKDNARNMLETALMLEVPSTNQEIETQLTEVYTKFYISHLRERIRKLGRSQNDADLTEMIKLTKQLQELEEKDF